MRLSRSLTSQICRVLIGVLLFAQLAVSAYACPGLTPKAASLGADMGMLMPVAHQSADYGNAASGCNQMDPNAANLCLEHCRAGHQSSDTAPVPVDFATTPALLYVIPNEPELLTGSSPSLLAADSLVSSAPPPHAILHCVLRI
jgi:hypothetical protein